VTPSALVLLPGLEGAGLFDDLISALPPALSVSVVRDPMEQFLSFSDLVPLVEEAAPHHKTFVLVAESYATPLAVKFAAARPPNLAGLVISAGFIRNPSGRRSWLVRVLARPVLFHLSPPSWLFKHFLIGASPPAGLEARVRAALKLVKPGVLARRLRAVVECDAREELAGTEIPLLYLQAENDNVVRPECFREILSLRPDTALVTIPAPHMLIQSQPRMAAEAIMHFIRQLAD
jgi:pimeloyl-[acyl-carrier protein] methyl ester esterase